MDARPLIIPNLTPQRRKERRVSFLFLLSALSAESKNKLRFLTVSSQFLHDPKCDIWLNSQKPARSSLMVPQKEANIFISALSAEMKIYSLRPLRLCGENCLYWAR